MVIFHSYVAVYQRVFPVIVTTVLGVNCKKLSEGNCGLYHGLYHGFIPIDGL
jgi:hypothetical protein